MQPAVLLGELRALADNPPDFAVFTSTSRTHHEWLGKAYALASLWDDKEARIVTMNASLVSGELMRDNAVSSILAVLYRIIASLEIRVAQEQGDRAFGPGAVYDFFVALREILGSAKRSIFIVDPYLDNEIFDSYVLIETALLPRRELCSSAIRFTTAALNSATDAYSRSTTGPKALKLFSYHARVDSVTPRRNFRSWMKFSMCEARVQTFADCS